MGILQKESHPVNFEIEAVPQPPWSTSAATLNAVGKIVYMAADSTMISMTGLKLSRRVESVHFWNLHDTERDEGSRHYDTPYW